MIQNEIRPLTGVRGLAALWVVFMHFETDFTRLLPGFSVLHPLFSKGGLGVDIFFVLSGFVISMVYKVDAFKLTARSYKGFLVNRLARIYPDYLFCLLLLAAMVAADQFLGKHMTDVVNYPKSNIGWHVLMLQAWPLIPANWDNWNTPAWSVSAEWFAYTLIFPLAIGLASISFLKRFRLAIVFIILALFAVFSHLACKQGMNSYFFIWRIFSEFLSGCLIYLFCQESPHIVKWVAARLDPIILFFVAVVWLSSVSAICGWLMILIIPLIIIGLTQESSWFSKTLSSSFCCYLGRVSYALYLVHEIAHRLLHALLGIGGYLEASAWVRMTVFLAYLIFPVLIAVAIYHLVEEPARLAIRRWGNLKPKPQMVCGSNIN